MAMGTSMNDHLLIDLVARHGGATGMLRWECTNARADVTKSRFLTLPLNELRRSFASALPWVLKSLCHQQLLFVHGTIGSG